MRFLCDQDVDADVRSRLLSLGHEAWTAYEAGLADAADDDLAVYAHEKNAVLVTHDREFSQRRRRWIIGRHLWLRCSEADAMDLLAKFLPDLLGLLERHDDLFVALSSKGFEVTYK